jgi:hypothetical protein
MSEAGVRTLPAPRTSRYDYGSTVLGPAAVAMVGTLPGRTQGVGLVTEPALCVDAAGSHAAGFFTSAGIVSLRAVAAAVVSMPEGIEATQHRVS